VTPGDFAWTGKSAVREVFAPGDVDLFLIKEIRGQALRVSLDQRPDVQGALVVIENSTGAIKAMVGGYDFDESKFNRARQAARQAGSSFKPYIYAAVLMDGATPFDTILDAPVSFPTASGVWSPHNYDYKYRGTITLLRALAESRNIPTVRLLSRVGVDKVIKLCRKFGITSRLVPNLPLALGASDLSLLEHTSAFTTFPNDGVHISPRMIYRVTNYDGRVIDEFAPEVTDVLPAAVARVEVSMLREVVNSGTSTRAKSLGRPVAGKTGTTNDFADAAFIGFTPSVTAGVWVGYDDRRSLGNKEEGGRLALPIWIDFMGEALKDQPVEDFPHSPLLTKPEQVQEIIASAGTERLLAARTAEAAAGGEGPRPAGVNVTARPAPTATSPQPSQPGGSSSSSSPQSPSSGGTKPSEPQRTSALPGTTAPTAPSSAPN
jgi:penicillin-binding protein 1A